MSPQSVNERLVPEVRAPEICEAPWAQVILRRWRSKYRREMHNENLGNVTGQDVSLNASMIDAIQ